MTPHLDRCPACESPLAAGVCRRCAFTNALLGLASDETENSSELVTPNAPEGFDLIHELGRGATAVVWLARERKLDRLVALKLISLHADRRLAHRLVREGQAAASLRHPHIVAIHSLGTTPADAYLSMEFLDGGDLRRRLKSGALPSHEAARLIAKLADALAHSHENQILHRDIKPSNVLLDARGEPKLGDFGLAAPAEGAGDLTLPGQVAGTAAYLPPELLEGAERATAQSDVYSLGAVFYECLTGRPPFIGDSASQIFAQIAQSDPPAPRLLQPSVPRDLETICLKCLHKYPSHRYASARALLDDLQRWRDGRPIAARPAGRLEKAFRWSRRNPVAATLAALLFAAVLSLAIGGPLAALRLSRAQARTAEEAASRQEVLDFLRSDLLAQASPDNQPDRDLKLKTVLDRAAAKIEGRFTQQPAAEAAIRLTLAETYDGLGEYKAAIQHADRARELFQRLRGPNDPEALRAGFHLADSLQSESHYAEAEATIRDVIERQEHTLGRDNLDTIKSFTLLGSSLMYQGKLADAATVLSDNLRVAKQALSPEHRAVDNVMGVLALVKRRQANYADAEALATEVLALRRKREGPESPVTLTAMANLAVIYQFEEKFAEAEKLQTETIALSQHIRGPEHPDTLIVMGALAASYQFQRKFAEAETLHQKTIAIKQRVFGPEHPSTLSSLNNLALAYQQAGRYGEAEGIDRRLVEAKERTRGAEHPDTLLSLHNLGVVLLSSEKLDEAQTTLQRVLSAQERVLGPEHPDTLQAQDNLGRVFIKQRRFAEAERMLRICWERRTKKAPGAWQTASTESRLGEALWELGRFDEAQRLLLEAAEKLKALAPKIPAANQTDVADALGRLERLREKDLRASSSAAKL